MERINTLLTYYNRRSIISISNILISWFRNLIIYRLRLTLLDLENDGYHIPLAVGEWTFIYDYFKPTTDTTVISSFSTNKVISIWRFLKSAITCMSHYLQINKC